MQFHSQSRIDAAKAKSAAAFADWVWPAVEGRLGWPSLISVENDGCGVHLLLDRVAGIDYLLEYPDGLLGLGVKISFARRRDEFCVRYWKNTVGYATQHQKTQKAIAGGLLFPALTMQAYCNGGLLAAACVPTIDLWEWLEGHQQLREYSNAKMLVASWDDLASKLIFRI